MKSDLKIDIEFELLLSLYHGNQLTQREISKIFKCSRRTIGNIMRRLNISTRSLSDSKRLEENNIGRFVKGKRNNPEGEFKKGNIPTNYIHIEPELLLALYWGNLYSIHDISKLLNLAPYVVHTKFKKYGIKTRSISEAMKINKEERSGKNSPNWRGGMTEINWSLRESVYPLIVEWRKKIFERDNWTCQMCEKHNNLNAHHIVNFVEVISKNNIKCKDDAIKCEELWDISNGITLCWNCHMSIHHPK